MTHRLTLDEVVKELRTNKRRLLEWLRAHPRDKHGEPFYTPFGRDKLFHQSDIARIELALREEVKCHSRSDRPAKGRRKTMKSAAPTGGQRDHSAWRQAAELTGDTTLLNSCEPLRNASTSTDAGQHRRPHLSIVPKDQHS